MITGGCLCGAVQFQISGDIRNIVYCHCSMCRKAQGTAFASNGIVAKDDFRFTQGEDNLSCFESSPGQHKSFCRSCGSPIKSENSKHPGQIRIRLGTLDGDIKQRPEAHIFVGSKANWHDICDDLPQYNDYEPGR